MRHEGDPGRRRALARRREKVAIATVVATRRSAPRPVGAKLADLGAGELCGSCLGWLRRVRRLRARARCWRRGSRSCSPTGSPTRRPGRSDCPAAARSTSSSRCSKTTALTARRRGDRARGERAVLFTSSRGWLRREAARARGRRATRRRRARGSVGAGGRADPRAREPHPRARRREGVRRGRRRRRACSSTEPSTRPRRCARRLGCSAGGRSSPTRARSLRRPSGMPSADEIIVEWPEEALARVAPDHATAVVVLTHDDKFDVPGAEGGARDGGVLHRRARLAAEPGAARSGSSRRV